jgi:2-polyprenyl-3-methyl-5-hydroxy-6-metoxy-1,4-benzoquinol methylase
MPSEPVDPEQLRARVESFPRWHYEFDLGGGVRTPITPRSHANRHQQRRAYFFDPLVRLCGGSLLGRRVLDLGCNAGFWSLAAIESGADFVHGLDGRQMHIDQANLVFAAKGIDPARYAFTAADVFAWDTDEQYDIVLCLGLLYHVSKPFELMERIARWNRDLLVIDTTLDRGRGAAFRLVVQDLDDPRAALDLPLALHPTSAAVVRMVAAHGYRAVMLRPRFTDWTGSERYRDGGRRAFICAKRSALEGLDAEPLAARAPRGRRWLRAVRAATRR